MVTRTTSIYRRLETEGKYSVSQYTYPRDLEEEAGGNFIAFFINVPQGSSLLKETRQVQDISGVISRTPRVQENNPINNRKVLGDRAMTKRIDTVIALYTPDNIVTSEEMAWEKGEINAGRNIADIYNRVSNSMFQFDASMIQDLVSSAGDIFNKDFLFNGFLDLANVGLSETELGNTAALIRREFRNPYMEFLFRGVSPRTFQFDFKFFPRSQKEAETVRNIVNKFREVSKPDLVVSGGILGSFFSYPAEFDIVFFSKNEENRFLYKMSTSALTNVTVNYAAQGNAVFHKNVPGEGSPPVATTISLTFMELELLHADRIRQGY